MAPLTLVAILPILTPVKEKSGLLERAAWNPILQHWPIKFFSWELSSRIIPRLWQLETLGFVLTSNAYSLARKSVKV